jgi:CRP/FNR family cyclic AMP-dependent transcriptional regulator
MQQRQQVAQLSKVPLFANCSKRELARLLSLGRTETVDAGHTLFVEGAPSSNLYVVLTGSAVVKKNGRRIARVGPGDVVGEISVILGGPRTATVQAETPIEWLVLDQASLRAAIDEVPGLGWHLLQSVAARLDQANKRTGNRNDWV